MQVAPTATEDTKGLSGIACPEHQQQQFQHKSDHNSSSSNTGRAYLAHVLALATTAISMQLNYYINTNMIDVSHLPVLCICRFTICIMHTRRNIPVFLVCVMHTRRNIPVFVVLVAMKNSNWLFFTQHQFTQETSRISQTHQEPHQESVLLPWSSSQSIVASKSQFVDTRQLSHHSPSSIQQYSFVQALHIQYRL